MEDLCLKSLLDSISQDIKYTSLWAGNSTSSCGCICTSIKYICKSVIAESWKQPKYLLKWRWLNKWKYICTVKYYLIKNNKLDHCVLIWKNIHVYFKWRKLQNNLISVIPSVGVYVYWCVCVCIHINTYICIFKHTDVHMHIYIHPYIRLVNFWKDMLLTIWIYLSVFPKPFSVDQTCHVWEPMSLAANVGFLGQAHDPWNLPKDSLWRFLVNWGESHRSGPVKAEKHLDWLGDHHEWWVTVCQVTVPHNFFSFISRMNQIQK